MFKFVGFIVPTALILSSVPWSGDFRNNNWGDSPADVETSEGEGSSCSSRGPHSNYKEYTCARSYLKTHLGFEALILYEFTPEEKLAMGSCLAFKPEVISFYRWEEVLSGLYGEPENRDEFSTGDESILDIYYRGDAGAVEEGVLKGYFALIRYWETEKTHIWLAAEMAEDELMVYIKYHSKEYFDLYTKENGKTWPRRGLPPWFDTENK